MSSFSRFGTLLVLIGAELILQGFGLDFEPLFNAILMAALVVAIIYHRQRAKYRRVG